METPFIYGKLAIGNFFTNRDDELRQLKQNFVLGTNIILISPRRWGKSSLVKRASEEISRENKSIRIVHFDMFNIRREEDFYQVLSESLLIAVSNKFEELLANVKKFMKHWIPKITISPDVQQEISLGLDWHEIMKNPDEILNLAERIAADKNLKIVMCIDEFQNLGYFNDPLAFQKKLRSHWQTHQNVSYCLYGSKRHMLMEVFTSPSMPFYKFGSLMFLEKVQTKHWKDFIQKRFKSTGKTITKKQAGRIADLVEDHPYYVQQLAQLTWLRTKEKASDQSIDESLDSLVMQLSLLFQSLTEGLSTSQVNFLHAIVKEAKKLSSKETIEKYKLGTSANVSRIKKALINREIIDERAGKIDLLDPVYAIWLRQYYFIR